MVMISVALIGPQASGKSSLARCLANETFTNKYIPTIGVDVKYRNCDKNYPFDKMCMWDLTGNKEFSSWILLYLDKVSDVFLCYDSTDYDSYNLLRQIWEESKTKLSTKNVYIVSTKNDSCDTIHDWGRELAVRIDCPFIRTSSYNGYVSELLNCFKIKTSKEDRYKYCTII